MRADLSRLTAAACAAVLLAGCTPAVAPSPTASPTTTARPFTVITTDPAGNVDPAGTGGNTDALLVANLFQRLMLVVPSTGDLKPDLATDCLFTSRLTYECTLPEGLTFHNGDLLDSSDVKFSIQRALRIASPDSSIRLLAALKRIDTPDAKTIEFHLSWPDNQFGYALAAPAASIVDEQVYPADALLESATAVGSGPYLAAEVDPDGAELEKFPGYLGPRAGSIELIQLSVVADSVAAEAAIAQGNADVVWRSLDSAAVQRLVDEIAGSPSHATATGFTKAELPGLRVTRLAWNPASKARKNDKLRLAVAKALQGDRTLDSLVPQGVADHTSAFPLGGRAKLPKLNGKRLQITLGYDASAPGHADLARLLRDRLENLDSLSVRVVADTGADLWLTDQPAWVNTASGWLQSYLAHPIADSSSTLEELERSSRTTSGNERTTALADIQRQAALDNTVLPVSQSEGILFLGKGVAQVGEAFGNGQELGLWGLQRG